MPIPLPRLDDRRFDDLVKDGISRAKESCPSWTDFTAGDPGVTLIEVFAFLTDALLYRLNRIPPKLQLALLNLVGVNLEPPTAAAVDLLLCRSANADASNAISIPAGTIAASDDGSAEFVFLAAATIAPGAKDVSVKALNCALIDAEPLGKSSGIAGQAFTVQHPPVIAPSLDGLDFMLGVEVGEAGAGQTVREVDGIAYEAWAEASNFTDCPPGAKVYVLDRASGRVQFSPSASQSGNGAVPPSGANIRAWYRRGGGRAGNIAAGKLTQLKPPIVGIEVTNPERAAGGSDGETLDALIRRAPSCLTSLRVAVTAHDYEQVTYSVGGIARSFAIADAELWRHAHRGVVAVRIMPEIETSGLQYGAITESVVRDHRTAVLKERAEAALEERRPLGVLTHVDWIDVRAVSVNARVMTAPGADLVEVEHGVLRRLNALLSPLSDRPLGQQIRASEIYEQMLGEPGVRYADSLVLTIEDTPKVDVADLVRDPHQDHCWFAVTSDALYRTLDDGESWSVAFKRDGLKPHFARRHPAIPGLMVLGAAKNKGTAVFLTENLGESWGDPIAEFDADLFDAAWVDRSGKPTLILAVGDGLRQLTPGGDSAPSPVIVDKAVDAKGFYSVVSNVSPSGVIAVAAAARGGGGGGGGGIYLSPLGGLSETFHLIGLKDDIRHLAVQNTGSRDFLWAALEAEAEQPGQGALRIELRANGQDDPGGFVPFNLGWDGGSCEAIAFAGAEVFAASNRAGVFSLNVDDAKPSWTAVKIDAGLPIRDTKRLLETVGALAASLVPDKPPIVMSGGPRGVYRSSDGGVTYSNISGVTFTDRVPIPRGWLYVSGEHRIEVVSDSGARI